jgi:hypothetical protein
MYTALHYIIYIKKEELLLLFWWSVGIPSPCRSGTALDAGHHDVRRLLHSFPCGNHRRSNGTNQDWSQWNGGVMASEAGRMYSAIVRTTARPSVSKLSRTADSMCRSHSAAESNTGRTAPSEGGASATWMGLSPRASRKGFASLTHPTTRSIPTLFSARSSSTLASLSWNTISSPGGLSPAP